MNHNADTNCVLQGQSQCLGLRKKSETVTGNGKCWPQCFSALPRSPEQEPCQYGSQPKCEKSGRRCYHWLGDKNEPPRRRSAKSFIPTAGASVVRKLTDLSFSQLWGRCSGSAYRASPRGPFYNRKVTQWGVTGEAGSEMRWPWCQWAHGCPQPGPVLQAWSLSVGATRSMSLASLPLPHCVPPGWAGHSVSWVGPWLGSEHPHGVSWEGGEETVCGCGQHLQQWGWTWWGHGPSCGHVWGRKGQNCHPLDQDAVLQCCWGAGAHSGRPVAGSRQGGCRTLIN